MMVNLRRAIVWASAGQYLVIAINFACLLVLARLLTPAEYGVSLLGGAILAIAEAVRELAGGAYLVRERELTLEKVRSTTTLSALVTVVVAAILTLAAGPLAHFFGLPALTDYLAIAVLGYLLGPFIHPQMALFSR
ncbi:MAG: oligosaccharide flippase family protein, partial [Hyphomicrobiaceae bacterium]